MSLIRNIVVVMLLAVLFSCAKKESEKAQNTELDHIQSQLNQLTSIDRARFHFENSTFPNIQLNDTLEISQLGDGYLFLRVSELHCQDCIEDISLFINDHFSTKKHLVVILGQFKSERAMSIYLRKLNLLETNWFLVNEIEGCELESTQAPYAFLLINENRIDNLWLPHYSLPQLSNDYILSISRKLIGSEII